MVGQQTKETMGLYDQLGEKTKNTIPNAKLVEIPNVGHLPHIESLAKFITALIDFLKK